MNGRIKEFIFSSVFVEKKTEKIFFFFHSFSKNSRIFFHRFPKTAEKKNFHHFWKSDRFFKRTYRLPFVCKLVICPLYHFQGSTNYLNSMEKLNTISFKMLGYSLYFLNILKVFVDPDVARTC